MFLNPQTVKFIEERDHYLRQNAMSADDLSDYHFKKIADRAGVSLDTVKNDAEAYKVDLKHHRPPH